MLTWDEFSLAVSQAYDHLYDMAFLRHHLLTEQFAAEGESMEKAAWRLHRMLLDAIEALNPGTGAPTNSWPWRRYRLLHGHYVEGESPETVAYELGISRRHFYREKERALAVIAELWWRRSAEDANLAPGSLAGASPEKAKLELLHHEVSRLGSAGGGCQLAPIVYGVFHLCQPLAEQRQLAMCAHLPDDIPLLQVDEQMLLHALLGLVNYGVQYSGMTGLCIKGSVAEDRVRLLVHFEGAKGSDNVADADQVVALQELAATQHMSLRRVEDGSDVSFELTVFASPPTVVLVIDDNPDIHDLFRRYLSGHGYHLVAARTANEALAVIRDLEPDVITIDLMMPEQDGLSLLERIRNQPQTENTPVIVCSVLEERELALSLGADCFLSKPVTQENLLAALRAVSPG
jgi:CheY-like chemotaxis protein